MEQLKLYPKGKHDDGLEALQMVYSLARDDGNIMLMKRAYLDPEPPEDTTGERTGRFSFPPNRLPFYRWSWFNGGWEESVKYNFYREKIFYYYQPQSQLLKLWGLIITTTE